MEGKFMAKQKYKTVYLSDDAEAKKIFNALEESGQLEAAIKLTKETALKYAKKATLAFLCCGVGLILPYGVTAFKLWQGLEVMADTDQEEYKKVAKKCKRSFGLGFVYAMFIGYFLGNFGLFKKTAYPRFLIPQV